MERANKIERTYISGKALSTDMRISVISVVDKIVKHGSDIISGYFPGKFSDVSKAVEVSRSTAKNMWTDHSIKPRKHGGEIKSDQLNSWGLVAH